MLKFLAKIMVPILFAYWMNKPSTQKKTIPDLEKDVKYFFQKHSKKTEVKRDSEYPKPNYENLK